MTVQMGVVINRKLPGLKSLLEDLPDWRKQPQYTVRELAMGVILIFLFKRGSRNNADNTNRKGNFSRNSTKVFGCRIPDTDTSHLLMEYLSPEILEKIKQSIVQKLIRDKTFARWRTDRKRYCIAVDGTGVHSFKAEPYPNCCYKESKNGNRTYSSSVMEAKLLCPNGFSISILTEWIINDPDNTKNNKQDCEQKAFVRLSRKLKAAYPQLAVCILGDGLYPNDNIFKICKANNWDFIFTFKDGNLTTIWEEITSQKQDNETTKFEYLGTENSKLTTYNGFWLNDLIYKKHTLHVIENNVQKIEKTCRFVHITNIEINKANFKELSQSGRLRWKIENEGFNDLKNGGYNLTHKYVRKSHKTYCNYYQCMQIAHIINQLNALSLEYKKIQSKNANESQKSLLEFVIGAVTHDDFDIDQIKELFTKKCQFRYE
jgi:hypothetical protein